MGPVEVASVKESVEDFNEQIGGFFLRSATDKEALESLVNHQRKVFRDLKDDFTGYSELISNYPSYGASALVGMVKFEPGIDDIFESILNDGSLLMEYSIGDIRSHIKMEKSVLDLARWIIDMDENVFMMIAVLLWSANKQNPALKKLGK